MLDRVTGMQVFARVAGLGSLSAAARALGMSQTMATKHMAALEARLGIKLMHRTTRRLSLTEAGREYLDAAERLRSERLLKLLPNAHRVFLGGNIQDGWGTGRLVHFGILHDLRQLPVGYQ